MTRARKPKYFPKPAPTKIGKRIALMGCILHRDRFTEADIESLARGFGETPESVRVMVEEELSRRETRREDA